MMTATASLKFSSPLAAAALIFCLGGGAAAQSAPDSENGRYVLSPVAGGVIRLDTRTGAVSSCSNTGTGWACYAVPDERAAMDAEIGRLQADNAALRAQLATREPPVTGKIDEPLPKDEALPKGDSLKKAEPKAAEGDRRLEIPLPSDRDMDRAMSFLERAWRRLIEMANRVQKDAGGKI